MRKLLLILFFLPLISSGQNKESRHFFSHALKVGYGYQHIPTHDWSNMYRRRWMGEYEFGYKNKYFVGFRYMTTFSPFWGWAYDTGLDPVLLKRSNQIGFILMRRYRLYDLIFSYNFLKNKTHNLQAGLGLAYKKGQDEYLAYIIDPAAVFVETRNVEHTGIAAELSYNYNFLRYITSGASLTYRTYTGGDPMLSAEIHLGVLLRH